MDHEALCHQVIAAVREVGSYIQQESRQLQASDIGFKGKNDLVTKVDVGAEQELVKQLRSLMPEAGILAEEEHQTHEKDKEYNWIIDPLDGTLNFVQQIPVYAISVALMQGDEVKLGVVLELNLDECFYAYKGGGAWLNNDPIQVASKYELESAFFATGFPQSVPEQVDFYIDLLKAILKRSRGVRRIGSAAVDLCYTAAGRFDCYYEFDLKPWDVAAGSLIVNEAGGTVKDIQGGTNYIFGKSIAAGSNTVLDEFLKFYNTFQQKNHFNDN